MMTPNPPSPLPTPLPRSAWYMCLRLSSITWTVYLGRANKNTPYLGNWWPIVFFIKKKKKKKKLINKHFSGLYQEIFPKQNLYYTWPIIIAFLLSFFFFISLCFRNSMGGGGGMCTPCTPPGHAVCWAIEQKGFWSLFRKFVNLKMKTGSLMIRKHHYSGVPRTCGEPF